MSAFRWRTEKAGEEPRPEKIQGLSRKSDTIFGQWTILEPSMPHIGREVALVTQAATLVYINAGPSQIAEMTTHQFRNRTADLSRSNFSVDLTSGRLDGFRIGQSWPVLLSGPP
jgi:hypothetical protein